MDLYIYYQAPRKNALLLQSGVETMQAQLRARHGVFTALKRRPREEHAESAGDTKKSDTWMEVYLSIPAGFEYDLSNALARTALDSLIEGTRHIEHFQDCAPCV